MVGEEEERLRKQLTENLGKLIPRDRLGAVRDFLHSVPFRKFLHSVPCLKFLHSVPCLKFLHSVSCLKFLHSVSCLKFLHSVPCLQFLRCVILFFTFEILCIHIVLAWH